MKAQVRVEVRVDEFNISHLSCDYCLPGDVLSYNRFTCCYSAALVRASITPIILVVFLLFMSVMSEIISYIRDISMQYSTISLKVKFL